MSALIYRRVFGDTFGLQALSAGQVPDMEDVRRRLFVAERRTDTRRPDHFYRQYLDHRMSGIEHVHALPSSVLSALAKRFITREGGRLHVPSEAYADWQELLPMVSPLAILVAFLVEEGRGPPAGTDPRAYLAQEIGETALLHPRQAEIDALIERDGLNELHMHLNGTTEFDIIWADAVRLPDVYYSELGDALAKSGGPTREFYDQLELGLTPFEVYRRLRATRRARHVAASIISGWMSGKGPRPMSSLLSVMNIQRRDGDCPEVDGMTLSARPVEELFSGPLHRPIIDEAAFLYIWLQAIATPGAPRAQLGLALYHNMLVLTQLTRISVQQVDEVGFDQFQKYTLVGVREHLERAYEARFRQLNGSVHAPLLKHLEGRLAPKKDVASFLSLIGSISEGYLRYRGCPDLMASRGLSGSAPGCMTGGCGSRCPSAASGRSDAELALVVHFIKRLPGKISGRPPQARDLNLRHDLYKQAQVVRQSVERHRFVRQILRGMDAASNELHAAPEVFAPIFRYLRRHALQRATFHVGEDFVHLVSGIRACEEAIRFLPLGSGDRMGHATALGISSSLWRGRTGPRLMIRRCDHLDDLVYAHSRLIGNAATALEAKGLEPEIARLSAQVYVRERSPAILARAWALRHLDITEVLSLERSIAIGATLSDMARAATDRGMRLFEPARKAELKLIAAAINDEAEAFELFRKRHADAGCPDPFMEIDAAWLSDRAVKVLQETLLSEMANKGVAIETLPTSNVRISAYDRLSEHHLFRWLNLTEDGFSVVPAICVGSDDTGIFATNIRNEYAAIFDVLRRDFRLGSCKAEEVVKMLNANGSAYRFRPVP